MTPVPYFRPNVSEAETASVTASLMSGWLTSGPKVAEFETEFADAVGAQHAVALNSCTAALHLGLLAVDVQPGDEVIVPTLTFASTAEVVLAVGAVPVLADCDPGSLCVDPAAVEAAITKKTKAVMPMHYGGTAADMTTVLDICATHPNIRIVEDAAHAFPTRLGSRRIGSIGDATCFSFYANKTMTTGEGGMLTTNSRAVADTVRQLSLHGLSRDAWARFETRSAWDYDIVAPGWKYNMTDAAAALGVVQLSRADGFALERRSIAAAYDQALKSLPGLRPRERGPLDNDSCHLYVVRVDPQELGGRTRDDLIRFLAEREIGTSVHYRPLHMHSYYAKQFGFSAEDFPVAADQFSRIVSLPIFPGMTTTELETVITAISSFVEAAT